MKRLSWGLAAIFVFSFGAAQAFDISADAKTGYFSNKLEYQDSNSNLKTDGLLNQLDITTGHSFNSGFRVAVKGSLMKSVAADGNFDSSSEHVNLNNVDLSGYKLELNLGYGFPVLNANLFPYLGLGLDSTKFKYDYYYNGNSSVTERVKSRYFKAGIDCNTRISDKLGAYAKASLAVPVKVKAYDEYSLSGSDSSTSGSLGKKVNYDAEAGVILANNINLGVFYEWKYYGKYTNDITGDEGASSVKYTNAGVKIGVSF